MNTIYYKAESYLGMNNIQLDNHNHFFDKIIHLYVLLKYEHQFSPCFPNEPQLFEFYTDSYHSSKIAYAHTSTIGEVIIYGISGKFNWSGDKIEGQIILEQVYPTLSIPSY